MGCLLTCGLWWDGAWTGFRERLFIRHNRWSKVPDLGEGVGASLDLSECPGSWREPASVAQGMPDFQLPALSLASVTVGFSLLRVIAFPVFETQKACLQPGSLKDTQALSLTARPPKALSYWPRARYFTTVTSPP